MPELSTTINGKKYMWDGVNYETEKNALETKKTYEAKGFEVELVKVDDQPFLYSRRVVTEVVVEGEPPAS